MIDLLPYHGDFLFLTHGCLLDPSEATRQVNETLENNRMNNLPLFTILIDSLICPRSWQVTWHFKRTPFLHGPLLPAPGAFYLLVEQNQYSVILCHLDVTLCKQ